MTSSQMTTSKFRVNKGGSESASHKANVDIFFEHERAKEILTSMIEHSPSDRIIQGEVEKVMTKMFRVNPQFDPDTLTRAAFFVVKSKRKRISEREIQRITHDSGNENHSWPNLVPVIKRVTEGTK